MKDYSALDAAICQQIRGNNRSFSAILGALGKEAAASNPKEPFRAIDSRLQALRRRGVLEYDRKNREWDFSK